MKTSATTRCSLTFILITAACAAAHVEEQIVAPYNQDNKYVVSDRGVHLGAVVRKGSRLNVIVDGVTGPKIDDVVTPVTPWVDPRPVQLESTRKALGEPADEHPPQPITFSKDGKHYAYLARVGQEWMLISDNKEVLRLPMAGAVGATGGISGSAGNTDIRLEFSGPDGKHLLFAKSGFQGYELWVDGQKWPGFFGSGSGGSEGTIDPLISPNGEHIAYVAQIDREKRALILDGKDAGYLGYDLCFTADSKHLVSRSNGPKGISVLVDGKSIFSAKQILSLSIAPVGSRVAAVLAHEYPDHSQGQFVLIDGKPAEATLCKGEVKQVIFSSDGKHYAAICSNAPNIWYAVVDGKKGQEYGGILVGVGMPPLFSPDSTKLAYIASAAGKYFLVVGDEESDAFDNTNLKLMFSADGKHTLMNGWRNGQSVILFDGKPVASTRDVSMQSAGTFLFSADGTHYAYRGAAQYGGEVFLDGKSTGFAGTSFALSSDGKHLAISGAKIGANDAGLVIDNQFVKTGERPPTYEAFSTDDQHLYYVCREPSKGPNAAPGSWDLVTYLDGKPVVHIDTTREFFLPPGYSLFTIHPGWQVLADGSLAFIGAVGDQIKKFVITPATDTNVASLITDAQAAAAEAEKARKKK